MRSKKLLKQLSTFCACFIIGCTMLSAQTQYCKEPISVNDNVTVYYTCQSLGGDLYEIKFESDEYFQKSNVNFYANTSEGNFDIGAALQPEEDIDGYTRILSTYISSTSLPDVYVAHLCLVLKEYGFIAYNWPTDIDWTAECETTPIDDEEAPTNFTATIGTVRHNSVELILKAEDNLSNIFYTIEYGEETRTTTAPSGVERFYTVSGLNPETTYTFKVTARDASNNTAEPVDNLTATTTAGGTIGNDCSGWSVEDAGEGAFENGYNYFFSTSGNDVTIVFELLDVKDGVEALLRNYTEGAEDYETRMDPVEGRKFTLTLPNQSGTLSLACKFAFAGGMAITRTFEYSIGNNCNTTSIDLFEKESLLLYPNPAQEQLQIKAENEIALVTIYNASGKLIKTVAPQAKSLNIDLSDIIKGQYFVTIELTNGKQINEKIIKL